MQFHCRATECSVDRTGPSAALQHFAQSMSVVPAMQLQQETLSLIHMQNFSVGWYRRYPVCTDVFFCFFFFFTCVALTETKGYCEPPCVAVMRTVMIKPKSALTVSTSVDSKSSVRLLAMTKSSNYSLPVLCFLHSFLIHHCIDFQNCVLQHSVVSVFTSSLSPLLSTSLYLLHVDFLSF